MAHVLELCNTHFSSTAAEYSVELSCSSGHTLRRPRGTESVSLLTGMCLKVSSDCWGSTFATPCIVSSVHGLRTRFRSNGVEACQLDEKRFWNTPISVVIDVCQCANWHNRRPTTVQINRHCEDQITGTRHTGCPKKYHNFLCTNFNFKNYFTIRISIKFVIVLSPNIPPHLKPSVSLHYLV